MEIFPPSMQKSIGIVETSILWLLPTGMKLIYIRKRFSVLRYSQFISCSYPYQFIYLPVQVSVQSNLADDPCKDTKYKEDVVDTMRLQKDNVRGVALT